MTTMPSLREFRVEFTPDLILHLIFDMPGRSMNVFSNAAIHEIHSFATWLRGSDVRGVVVYSGKLGAFCAGADLGELGVAYDMIMATPRELRHSAAVDHFSPIGRAFRALETAGKPVAAAIRGLALGGGCELALGCHYRVMADDPQSVLGLPESLVGLLPGGGGTQRLPRLVGLEASAPILLDGARLSAKDAVAAGAAHEIVNPGKEIEAAERWVRSNPDPCQPWDRPDWHAFSQQTVSAFTGKLRRTILEQTFGHFPAPLAILDCVERGLPQSIDEGLMHEIDIFADLIQRPEPRNMIQTLFLGKLDYEKRRRSDNLPACLANVRGAVASAIAREASRAGGALEPARVKAGFTKPIGMDQKGTSPPEHAVAGGEGMESASLWFENPVDGEAEVGARLLGAAALAASAYAAEVSETEQRVTDYAIVQDLGFPAYLGGPFALLRYLGRDRLNRLMRA